MGKLTNSTETEELRRTLVKTQKQLAQSKAKTADLVEAIYHAAKDASLIIGSPPPVPKPIFSRKRGAEERAIIHASDWQIGKHTETFNTEVAYQRVGLLGNKVERLVEIQRADHPVKIGHLFLGGDMVEGVTIFPGQAWEVDSTLFDQLFASVDIMHRLVLKMLSIFEYVFIDCEDGNHGRIGRRGDVGPNDNMDRIAYRILADRLENERKRCFINQPKSWYQLPQVGNYRPLLVHGDEIKGFGGNTPLFGIIKKCNAWASGVIPDFSDVFMGHFHQAATPLMARGTAIRMNGTLESDNQYAREFMAATGRPAQRCVFVEPIKGMVTADYVLYLDGE